MDEILKQARALGALIQNEECYKQYIHAKEVNDDDEELQKAIGEFNLIKMNLDTELSKEDKDEEKLKAINTQLREVYSDIMANESMQSFSVAKKQLDELVSGIYSVLIRCASGENPDEVDIQSGCSGDCSSCGGCH